MYDNDQEKRPTIVCGIGASAGGLSPIEEFFDAMPSNTGVAFVVIQHLSPDHDSMMVSLLSSHTDMRVSQAIDGEALRADHVYLIAPGTQLAVANDVFAVTERVPDRREIPRPIDVFFKSLAINYGREAVAVVLSGTGTDGTLGIEAVRRAGGVTLAQDGSAAFDGMPGSANESGFIDSVLDPTAMANVVDKFAASGKRPHEDAEAQLLPEETSILAHIAAENEIDFREYKPGTIHRRLERRLMISKNRNLKQYAERLRKDPEERKALIDDLFIDVTSFFRDTDAFALVETEVMPALAKTAADENRPIRMWVPGCATGEEAYSLTMLAMEAAEAAGVPEPYVQTFATDVHGRALETASAGIYSTDRVALIPEERRRRFFDETSAGWAVKRHVRTAVTFAKHNLLTDAPFTRVDMVSCRNLLIYFRGPAQERAIASMGFALRNGGVMFLGSSETVGFAEPDYSTISATWRIFRKESDEVERNFRRNPPLRTNISVATPPGTRSSSDLAAMRAYDAILSEQFAAGLLVNDRREVEYVMGAASAWMQQPPGRPTNDVLSLISDSSLRLVVGASLRELESGSEATTPRPLPLAIDSENLAAQVLLGKKLDVGSGKRMFLLYVVPSLQPVEIAAAPSILNMGDEDQAAFAALETELRHTREGLQSSIEEQETSNEELNAANEELIASNEELQSTNEELSSVNEELRTLNDEHQRQLDQVLELTADLEQLMSSTEIAVVFLAEDNSVRRFNEPARDFFRIRDSDVGRPFDDVVSTLTYPEIEEDIERALSTGTRSARAVRNTVIPDQRLIAQVSRYDLARNRWGVLIAIVNITDIELADEQRMLASALGALQLPFIVWNGDGGIEYANNAAADWLGAATPEELVGTYSSDWGSDVDHHNRLGNITESIRSNETVSTLQRYDSGMRQSTSFPFLFDGIVHIAYRTAPLDALLHDDQLRHLRTVGAELRGIDNQVVIAPDNQVVSAEGPAVSQLPQLYNEASITAVGFDAAGHLAAIDRARSGETVQVREELEIDGSMCWHLFRYTSFEEDPLGETHPPGSVLLTTFEIQKTVEELQTARHRVSELEAVISDLEHSTGADVAMLAERNEDLDNFAHVAAHDLKAPVRSIRSFAEIALEDLEDDSPAAPHIEKVIDSSSRMATLIDSLLDFASIGRDSYEPEVIDLRNMIDEITVDLGSSFNETDAEFVVDLTHADLSGNPDGIRQVVSNLISNSLKFSGTNRPRITVTSETQEGGVLVSVTDNGIGFPSEESGRVFEPFQRLHATDQPGSGVGLAICRRIVQRHGGRIWASSEPDRGSTFSFWLPE